MKAFTLSPTFPLRTFSPCCLRRATSSRVKASRSTATNGPFPERKTACVGSSSSRRVAKFKPTRVFPAPGTPVTKQIRLRPFACASSTSSSTRLEVTCRFCAPASNRAIASTECCAYSARAASTIVGVGWYDARAQASAFTAAPPICASAASRPPRKLKGSTTIGR